MGERPAFLPPSISDADIAWACERLRLPDGAFSGPDGNDPRREILKSTQALDVEACPGSGKTTLLVAKLAILTRTWSLARQGICVLSHTNAARRGIEKLLGGTAECQQLLRYPHFVGTIQGFVDEFLAAPWLRSLGLPIVAIDDYYCELHRRSLLKSGRFGALATYVKRTEESTSRPLNIVTQWQIASPEFDVRKAGGSSEFKDSNKPAAKQLIDLARSCAGDGYHRYDEMYMWGNDLLSRIPSVRQAIRHRFPMLFIDEVQDNSEVQDELLFQVFVVGTGSVTRQRYGDSNQAIYEHSKPKKGASNDQFPERFFKQMPNSHRFGQEIADLARPLGLVPQDLVGCGPNARAVTADTLGKHAIFLFSDETVQRVLPSYAEYLCTVFSADDLRKGDYTAVAAVHRQKEMNMLPRGLRHYWPEYDPELTPAEPKPNTLYQYLTAGRKLSDEHGEAHFVVEKLAEGVLRLVRLSDPAADLKNRKRKHHLVLELLSEKADARNRYLDLVRSLAADRTIPQQSDWCNEWVPEIRLIAESIAGRTISGSPSVKLFLELPQGQLQSEPTSTPRDNVFRHPDKDARVRIRVGSIHSIKGETHTATLVLDSFFKRHHLETLKPWFLGQKEGGEKEGVENQSRLKQHYVAMTRPTHLLCLAMKENYFTHEEIEQLKDRQWRVARVGTQSMEWL